MNKSLFTLKRAAAASAVVTVLALSAAGISAQDSAPVQPPTTEQGQGFGFGQEGRGQGGQGDFGGRGRGHGGQGDFGRGRGGLDLGRGADGVLIGAAADALGVDATEIVTAMREGSVSLADYVTQAGGDADAVLAAALTAASDRISAALAAGQIDQTQADALLANVEARLTEAFTTAPQVQRAERLARRVLIEAAAEALAVDGRDLRTELEAGTTLAQVLSDAGVDVDSFLSDVSARLEARLNVQVVDGELTADEAATLLADLQASLEARINEPWTSSSTDAAAAPAADV